MADGAFDLTVKLLGLAKLAVLKPIKTKVLLLFATGRPSAGK
jgi:hypothetical protein